jgi:hypothetical protein
MPSDKNETEPELNDRSEAELNERLWHPLKAKHHAAHAHKEGHGDEKGEECCAFGSGCAMFCAFGFSGSVGLNNKARAIADIVDRFDEAFRLGCAFNARAFRREIDGGACHARHRQQRLFDACDAGGAGHAVNGEGKRGFFGHGFGLYL